MFGKTEFQDANKEAEINTFNAVGDEGKVKCNNFKST